jgi:cytidine deaminase
VAATNLKTYRQLAQLARSARRQAVAPFSRFRVGAALITRAGTVYTGCNVENSSFSLTICAERTAVFKAVSEGERSFTAIAVSSDDTGFTPPCGACRQVLSDLAGNIDFIMINSKNQLKVVKLKSLLPLAFTPKSLDNVRKKK